MDEAEEEPQDDVAAELRRLRHSQEAFRQRAVAVIIIIAIVVSAVLWMKHESDQSKRDAEEYVDCIVRGGTSCD